MPNGSRHVGGGAVIDPPPSEATPEALLTPAEAADLLRVPRGWVYEATRSRGLPHLKLGRYTRFLRSDLEAWVNEQRR